MSTHHTPLPSCALRPKSQRHRNPISLLGDRWGTGAEQLDSLLGGSQPTTDQPSPAPWLTLSRCSLLLAKVHTPSRCSVPGMQSRPQDTREPCADVTSRTEEVAAHCQLPPDSVFSSIQRGWPEHTGWDGRGIRLVHTCPARCLEQRGLRFGNDDCR